MGLSNSANAVGKKKKWKSKERSTSLLKYFNAMDYITKRLKLIRMVKEMVL
jgi:hypothetical protein